MANDAELERIAARLKSYLGGEVAEWRHIIGVEHATLAEAAGRIAPLTVDAAAIGRMLAALEGGRIIVSEAEQWAAFVRAGCFPQPRPSAVRPLNIRYTGAGADDGARIIARFDELGELDDQPLGDTELAEMIASMRAAADANAQR